MGRKKGKLSKGQPQGSRSASGRLRNRTPANDVPCMGVVRRRELHGLPANDVGEPDAKARKERVGKGETDTCDALGRAYCAGLLGTGKRAQDMLNAGRRIAWQYWRIFAPQFGSPDSLARFQPSSPGRASDGSNAESEQQQEKALSDALKLVRKQGHDVRRAFDQLVIDWNPDHGPLWLDQIVYAHKHKRQADPRDMRMLELALRGLDEVA